MIDIPTLDIVVNEDVEDRVKVRNNRGAVPTHGLMNSKLTMII
jgi:hypothetical protein